MPGRVLKFGLVWRFFDQWYFLFPLTYLLMNIITMGGFI
jgi:hypothetical protein